MTAIFLVLTRYWAYSSGTFHKRENVITFHKRYLKDKDTKTENKKMKKYNKKIT